MKGYKEGDLVYWIIIISIVASLIVAIKIA